MHKTEGHHILYKQAQKQTIGIVSDNTTVDIPTPYHKGVITKMQREGVPAITTTAKIELDKWLGNI